MLPVTITSNCFGVAHELHRRSCRRTCARARHPDTRAPISVDDVAPELRGLEHVRLVDRAEACRWRLRAVSKPDVRDAADLRLGVAHGVEALALAGVGRADAARLAEVDVAGELAHDHDVEAGDDLGLQRRGVGELGEDVAGRRFAKKSSSLRSRRMRLLRALAARQLCRTAGRRRRRTGPRRRRCASCERCLRQRIAVRRRRRRRRPAPPRARTRGRRGAGRRSTLHRLRDDLGADAVAGEKRDLHHSNEPRVLGAPMLLERPDLRRRGGA